MVTHDAQDIFPAAPVARQGDFLFVSTIYPLDGDGQVIRADAVSPHVGESDVAAQTRAVLNNLNDVLVNAGSSAERVVKAEVYLVDPTDFHEFKLAWKAFYPENPPARTTAVIGDDHLVSGCRLSVSAVALAGDATVDKETIHTSDAPDPMDAEWAPQAVKAAPFVFPSPFPATDFTTGVVGKTNPVAPYYGSDTELQAHYILGNWDKVLRAAGSGLDQALKAQIYGLDLANFHDLDGVWTQYVGREAGAAPPTRSAMAMRALMVPEAEYIANTVFLAPDASHEKTENRKGIRWHPEDLKNVHYSPGLSAGNWFFMAGQLAIPDYANLRYETAPRGLPHYFSDIEIQTEMALTLLQEQLAANDMSLRHVVDARIFLTRSRQDFRGFARAWQRAFEPSGHLPSMNYVPSNQADGQGGTLMPDDLLVEIDLIAHTGHASS